jgi:hypothetical protein
MDQELCKKCSDYKMDKEKYGLFCEKYFIIFLDKF